MGEGSLWVYWSLIDDIWHVVSDPRERVTDCLLPVPGAMSVVRGDPPGQRCEVCDRLTATHERTPDR